MDGAHRGRGQVIEHEVAIGDGVDRVRGRLIEAQGSGRGLAVDRKARPGQRRGTERAFVEPHARIGKAPAIAPQHLDIGQEVMAEGHRLGGLEMGEARHHRARVLVPEPDHHRLHGAQAHLHAIDRGAHPQAQIGRDLIIARARGVQAASGLAHELGQPRLDVEMDVLKLGREGEAAGLDLGTDPGEPVLDRRHLLGPEHAHRPQHPRVCQRALDVLRPQPLVEPDRGINLLHQGRGTLAEMRSPQVAPALGLVAHHPLPTSGTLPMPSRRTALAALLGVSLGVGLALTPGTAKAASSISLTAPKALPPLTFEDLAGHETDLAAFRGRVVVLNLWATWCLPCREEMPSLERLQTAFKGKPVSVIALSVDRAGKDRVTAFLDQIKVHDLAVYRDADGTATQTLKVPGLPATILVDREGREIGRVLGLTQWDSDAAKEAVQSLLDAPSG